MRRRTAAVTGLVIGFCLCAAFATYPRASSIPPLSVIKGVAPEGVYNAEIGFFAPPPYKNVAKGFPRIMRVSTYIVESSPTETEALLIQDLGAPTSRQANGASWNTSKTTQVRIHRAGDQGIRSTQTSIWVREEVPENPFRILPRLLNGI